MIMAILQLTVPINSLSRYKGQGAEMNYQWTFLKTFHLCNCKCYTYKRYPYLQFIWLIQIGVWMWDHWAGRRNLVYICLAVANFIGLQPIKTRAELDSSTV